MSKSVFVGLESENYGLNYYNEHRDIYYNITTPEDKVELEKLGTAITPEWKR